MHNILKQLNKNNQFISFFKKTKAIIKVFKKSPKNAEILNDLRMKLNFMNLEKLKLYPETRWNSMFYLFRTLNKNKILLKSFFSINSHIKPKYGYYNNDEWIIAENFQKIF